jgi:hypothetical protein
MSQICESKLHMQPANIVHLSVCKGRFNDPFQVAYFDRSFKSNYSTMQLVVLTLKKSGLLLDSHTFVG